ncbi:sensor histidine kinase [Phytohabitans kaempferiae]|uniref:Sensor histidine kinase n=1 Tax=Phytohabitans kaempferiae TaxID=1620943 RepID=A0ABV6LXN2_9ACTN
MSRFVAYAALCRALLLGRLVVTIAAVGVGLRLVDDTWSTVGTLVLITVTTAVQVTVLSKWPGAVRWQLSFLVLDAALMITVLVTSGGGIAFFCYAAGHAALTGALLGTHGLPLWGVNAALGLAVATQLLRVESGEAGTSIAAPFMLAFPMIDIVCGFGAAVATAALARYIDATVTAVTAAQHLAAASERARLARELHDSVAKTLRGVSFAAVALPGLLRRQPDLAEQLASTVSEGADAAVREARDLLAGLRRDLPDRPFPDNVRDICGAWSERSGVPVQVTAVAVEPPVAARYELAQILGEALQNVTRHAKATLVLVGLRRSVAHVELTVTDDGDGFPMPDDLTELSGSGSFGIIGMAERAQALGGILRVESRPGTGTTVVAQIPLSGAVPTAHPHRAAFR